MTNGSNAGVSIPSPKSPIASRDRKSSIESMMHSLIFGSFLLHTFIVDAGNFFDDFKIKLNLMKFITNVKISLKTRISKKNC